jgi:26S proteasome non-ATPase regulatory subunit 10
MGESYVLLPLSICQLAYELGTAAGFTPLITAASGGSTPLVRELVGSGADVKAANNRGQTALHYAASKGHVEVTNSHF